MKKGKWRKRVRKKRNKNINSQVQEEQKRDKEGQEEQRGGTKRETFSGCRCPLTNQIRLHPSSLTSTHIHSLTVTLLSLTLHSPHSVLAVSLSTPSSLPAQARFICGLSMYRVERDEKGRKIITINLKLIAEDILKLVQQGGQGGTW